MQTKRNRWLDSAIKAYVDTYGKTEHPTIYEVGSRDAEDAVELAQRIMEGDGLFGNPTIVVFEANPPQQKIIEQNYPKLTLIKEAISDKAGEVEFLQIHGDKNFVGSSTMNTNRNDSWIKDTSTIKVKTRRLDDVIEELGHQKTEIDIMKVDIEGYTMEALRSMGKYLHNVKVFHLETEVEGAARAETNLDIALYMTEQGYTCTAIEYEWPPSIEDQVWRRND